MYGKKRKNKVKTNSPAQKGVSKLIVPFWCLYVLCVIAVVAVFNIIGRQIPSVEQLEKDIQQNHLATIVYAADGSELGRYFFENRSNCRYADLSENIIKTLISTEDARFYQHSGIDFRALLRVAVGLGTGLKNGGGSTITQQLAKNLYGRDPDENLIVSKLKEWIVAVKLEREYSKDEILTLYLNTVDFSHQAMGIQTAAERYFATTPDRLTIEQSALLVGMLKAPGNYNPLVHPEAATQRRNVVIGQLQKYNVITAAEADSIAQIPLDMSNYTPVSHSTGSATYFREYLRTYLTDLLSQKENLKKNGDKYNIYTDGLKIYTTIDPRMQEYAEQSVNEHVVQKLQPIFFKQLERNDNAPFYGLSEEQTQRIMNSAIKQSTRYHDLKSKGKSDEEIMAIFKKKTKMKILARSGNGQIDTLLSPYDSIRYMKSFLQCGFMAMETNTGKIKAYVGGMNFEAFQYDHVMGSRRQVGSTFKPYVYASAMENSNGTLDPCTYVPNTSVSVRLPEGTVWSIPVSKYKPNQQILLREALAQSLNNVSAYLISKPEYGRQHAVIELVRKMGITSPIPEVPSICLGACELTLYEQVGAINCFANEGVYIEPYFITKICDKNGNTIYETKPKKNEAMSQLLAFQTVNLMRGVVNYGTGYRLISEYKLNFPLAGKTGTTNNHSDSWFVGYTPMLTCGVWVGCDDRSAHFTSMTYGQGARAAMPVFGRFMNKCYNDPELPYQKIVQNANPDDPCYNFKAPDGFVGNEYGCLPKDADNTETTKTVITDLFD